MADKGFQLKVIIPTDDGFNISDKGIEKASYYLIYNNLFQFILCHLDHHHRPHPMQKQVLQRNSHQAF